MLNYLSPSKYLSRACMFANNYLLGYFERIFDSPLNNSFALRHPPVFFLGAPRSGSTLAIQIITDALDFGYISNGHCQCYGAPALAEILFRPTLKKKPSDYCSRYGVADGSYAPSECGEWWYRFFRMEPPYVTLDDVKSSKMTSFRRSVVALTNAADRPIIFKNLYASLRIQPIAYCLPESIFIIINRNEVDNGHSLLEARYRIFGSYDSWLSIKPPNIASLKQLPPYQQVIEQIRQIKSIIADDLVKAQVPSSRCFTLNYEDLCASPVDTVNSIHRFLALNGCNVKKICDPPARFSARQDVRIDAEMYRKMRDYALSS